ncbi:MAG: ATP-binding protein [Clostridiaceae bacterium]|nr:ATP-binding protein [Clostridiaceae bacterium]
MRELSLHLMDIIQNSVKAGAHRIEVVLEADPVRDRIFIRISDNGCGMSPELLQRVTDPFFTTRKTRSVGLGIPLFKEQCEITGGYLELHSEVGKGTTVEAVLGLSSIDRLPLGNVSETITTLIQSDPSIDYDLVLVAPGRRFELDLAEIRKQMDDVPLNEPSVLTWLGQYIAEQQEYIFGGVLHEIISRA